MSEKIINPSIKGQMERLHHCLKNEDLHKAASDGEVEEVQRTLAEFQQALNKLTIRINEYTERRRQEKLKTIKIRRAIELLHQKAENEGFVVMPTSLLDRFTWVDRPLTRRLKVQVNGDLFMAAHYNEVMDNIDSQVQVALYQEAEQPTPIAFLVFDDRFYPLQRVGKVKEPA